MLINNLHRIGWFIGLLLLQVLILNNVNIGGYATPFLYIYLLLKFESETSRNTLLLWGFVLGLMVDIFSDTLGMNTIATVALAMCQPFCLHLYVSRDTTETMVPSLSGMGFTSFTKYAFTCILLHHTILYMVEFFSSAHLGDMLLRILTGSLLTLLCILAIESARGK
jgi:rod shape-determining protein MreD